MKNSRQNEIINIISSETVVTQEELIEKLRQRGYKVTQATVSRDIKELRLIKTADDRNKYRYTQSKSEDGKNEEKYNGILSDVVISLEAAGNLIVIKTKNGMGMAAATAVDSLGLPEIVGTIAGDDTVFVAAKTPSLAEHVVSRIQRFVKE